MELGGAHLTMTFGSWIPSYPPMHRGACPALRGRTLPHEDVVLICVGGWSVRYSKVGNYYYYSIAVTSLSLNLFTYVISIASAGLGTPASLQHAGKTVKFRAARNVYCIVSDHSSASIRCVKTCMIIGLDDQRSTCKDVVQCVRTKEHSAVDVHRVRM